MSYQVLARKWRPRQFSEMVGQRHVVQALTNSLGSGRLHHALLFSGTRGVGKTTIARIFAKSLNCERGVGPSPCGVCESCREVDEGRFIDLYEVDAASRTKVEQTRELLENIPYAPVKGRFKVYLIDEVHMFSPSSFNALLKTLEEPPDHVKFILATTDPQKVPVTVLSRCLQFALKPLLPDQIQEQLRHILEQEQIDHDAAALRLLAHAAAGSMRDALSLLDQAIAFADGEVLQARVAEMLGSASRQQTLELLRLLMDQDGVGLMRLVAQLADGVGDFSDYLQRLLDDLHRIALLQTLPQLADTGPDDELLRALARQVSSQRIQLYYQIALQGQADLDLAPDPRSGMEMLLLRMLAYAPADADVAPPASAQGGPAREPAPGSPVSSAAGAAGRQTRATLTQPAPVGSADRDGRNGAVAGRPKNAAEWRDFAASLSLGGMAGELAKNAVLDAWSGDRLRLRVSADCQELLAGRAAQRFETAIRSRLGDAVQLQVSAGDVGDESLASVQANQAQQRQQRAEQAFRDDALVRSAEELFGATVIEGSVHPLDS